MSTAQGSSGHATGLPKELLSLFHAVGATLLGTQPVVATTPRRVQLHGGRCAAGLAPAPGADTRKLPRIRLNTEYLGLGERGARSPQTRSDGLLPPVILPEGHT